MKLKKYLTKIFAAALAVSVMACGSGCTGDTGSSSDDGKKDFDATKLPFYEKDVENLSYDYSDKQRIIPIWQSNVIYNEQLMIVEKDGVIDGEKILSVTDDNPLPSGKMMIVTYNTAIDVDNVMVGEYNSVDLTKKIQPASKDTFYTLSFNADGGNITPSDQKLKAGEKPKTLPVMTRDGYEFLGWTDGEKTVDIENYVMPASNVTLKALWKKIENDSDSSSSSGKGCKGSAGGAASLMFAGLFAVVYLFKRKEND